MDSIVGVWTLRSFHMEVQETGERLLPFGPEPRGTLMLHPDGRMVALMTPGPGGAPPEGGSDGMVRQLVAYSGRYRLEPPDRLVTAVDVSCFPHWLGSDQERTCRVDGDTLEIVTPPGTISREGEAARTATGVLAWTRES